MFHPFKAQEEALEAAFSILLGSEQLGIQFSSYLFSVCPSKHTASVSTTFFPKHNSVTFGDFITIQIVFLLQGKMFHLCLLTIVLGTIIVQGAGLGINPIHFYAKRENGECYFFL